ncbi:1-aminocyclopropane-1-carboxylate synthase 1 [Westerdykella ornata]|uniref:1-aminocyclopropane-1-carboxylate synthase 1 n=1 Tax=Westerdykella ornata TaxID=318751 RepID=A0A6A6JD80_WESOR|nr:1-aminocyclopropane-1-carboxylate synthase 1 [Westerdykella ornata]KAF2274580.1 1-aminocyclopropane-1-carboxylate synthase 1 [Westerdykella ornata]
MLSSRGQKYAALDLAALYTNIRAGPYDKEKCPNGFISLTMAENFLMYEEMLRYIKTKCLPSIYASALTYHEGPFGSMRLRTAMADFLNGKISPASSISADNVSFVSGITALNEISALCLTEEDEGVLLSMPIYGSFARDFETKSNCKLIYTPFGDVDQFSVHAIDRYEQALEKAEKSGTKIRALIISNPHNPLGRCYTRDVLKALMRFCNEHKIHLISDEIYALSVYHTDDSHPAFTSVLSIDPSGIIDPNLVHVLYGMSKDFAAAGLRLGCLISENAEMTKAVRSLSRFHCASPLTCDIAATILEDKEFHDAFLEKSNAALREHQGIATKMLTEAGIPFAPKPNAGFFLWIDLSKCLRGEDWQAETILKGKLFEAGIEMSSGEAYHAETPGWFRFIFSVNRDVVLEGLRR